MDLRYLDCSYDEFPFSEKTGRNMRTIDADFSSHLNYNFVRVHVPYREVDGRTLVLDLITPQEVGSLPLVVYVPGSAWHKQDIEKYLGRLVLVARMGYVVALVEYRESDIAPFPAQAMDVKYAIQYLEENAEELGIAPGRIVVWGDSSGAHTALMSVFTRGVEGFTAPDLAEYPVAGVIDYYGPVDLYEMRNEPSAVNHTGPNCPEGCLLGHADATPENSRPADPREYIGPDTPPVLILHGDKDRQVPFGQSCLLNDALLEAGRSVELYRVHGADHGCAPFWSPEALGIVEGFLRRCLARQA